MFWACVIAWFWLQGALVVGTLCGAIGPGRRP